jgi:hypothetical protein
VYRTLCRVSCALQSALDIPRMVSEVKWNLTRESTVMNPYVKPIGDAMERVGRLLDNCVRHLALCVMRCSVCRRRPQPRPPFALMS